MLTNRQELNIWRVLTHFWGLLTAICFILTFFNTFDLSEALASLVFIYIPVLSLFTSIKEFHRWQDKNFISNHSGEFFVFLWTLLLIIFILLTAWRPNLYDIPGEFAATYIGILGIFALSRESRRLKRKRKK